MTALTKIRSEKETTANLKTLIYILVSQTNSDNMRLIIMYYILYSLGKYVIKIKYFTVSIFPCTCQFWDYYCERLLQFAEIHEIVKCINFMN